MEKHFIALHVNEDYIKSAGGIVAHYFEHDKYNAEFKKVGNKCMLVVASKEGENVMVVDSDYVIAVEYDQTMVV